MPLQADGITYKESFLLGEVQDFSKVQTCLDLVTQQFKANQYNLIGQNCNHFTEAFALQLLGKRIPSYINRASRVGFYISCFLPRDLKNQNPVPPESSQST